MWLIDWHSLCNWLTALISLKDWIVLQYLILRDICMFSAMFSLLTINRSIYVCFTVLVLVCVSQVSRYSSTTAARLVLFLSSGASGLRCCCFEFSSHRQGVRVYSLSHACVSNKLYSNLTVRKAKRPIAKCAATATKRIV